MFVVYDNGKLARFPEQKISSEWSNCKFNTLQEAIEYSKAYFWPCNGGLTEAGKTIDYSGYGDIAEIREE